MRPHRRPLFEPPPHIIALRTPRDVSGISTLTGAENSPAVPAEEQRAELITASPCRESRIRQRKKDLRRADCRSLATAQQIFPCFFAGKNSSMPAVRHHPALSSGLLPGKKDNLGQTACVRPCSGKRPDYARDNATTWQRKPLLPREIGKTCPPGDDPRQKNLPRPGEGKYIHPATPAGKDKKYPAGSARFPEEGKNIQTEPGCLRMQTRKAPCRPCPSRRMWL